jgi:cysteine desulfurase
MTAIYLDHNASVPALPAVAAAVADSLAGAGNPSSVHRFGRLRRAAIARAREAVAALVGAAPDCVVFTSGATEANALALRGTKRRALVSAVEHDSVRAARPDAIAVPVDREGVVDLGALERLLAADAAPATVSLMLANNETGVIQPVAEAARLAHARGAWLHCDATQAPGRIAVDMSALGADLMSLSAHKLGGPPGVGALVVAPQVGLEPLLAGGGQERGLRAGTENLPGVAGFAAAAEAALAAREREAARLAGLRDALEARLLAAVPDAVAVGRGTPRLPNTSALAMPGVDAATQVMALDLAGIAVSAGAACSSGRVKPSHVLAAMGLVPEIAGATIRVSLGWTTTAAELDRFAEEWLRLWARLGAPRASIAAA